MPNRKNYTLDSKFEPSTEKVSLTIQTPSNFPMAEKEKPFSPVSSVATVSMDPNKSPTIRKTFLAPKNVVFGRSNSSASPHIRSRKGDQHFLVPETRSLGYNETGVGNGKVPSGYFSNNQIKLAYHQGQYPGGMGYDNAAFTSDELILNPNNLSKCTKLFCLSLSS